MRPSLVSRLSATEIDGGTINYGEPDSDRTYVLLTFVDDHQDICVHDPRYASNGFDKIDPREYGITKQDSDELVSINEGLISLQNDSIQHVANRVQDLLGVQTGDLASHYFDNATTLPLFRTMAVYALRELQFGATPKPTSSPKSGLSM